MKGLTGKQKEILDFVKSFIETENMAPTVYEIADFFHIKTSTVFAHIKSLQKKQYLTRSSKARSIALTDKKPIRAKPREKSVIAPIPLLGKISPDYAVDAPENREAMIYCSPSLSRRAGEKLFATRVSDESMKDLGIIDGDIVIADQNRSPVCGDVVIARPAGRDVLIRGYHPDAEMVELRPAHPDYVPDFLPVSQVNVVGVVIGLQREY